MNLSRRVTRRLAWIQPVCISINAVPALKGLNQVAKQWDLVTGKCSKILRVSDNMSSINAECGVFSTNPYNVTIHSNRHVETIQVHISLVTPKGRVK